MSESPRLVAIVLCERILQDVLRRDAVSCINIYNGITAQSFPAVVPLLYSFAQIQAPSVGFEYQFRIVDSAGTLIAMSPPVKVDPLANEFITHKVISAFSGLTFQKEGVYEVFLDVDGKPLGSMPLQVLQLVAAGQEAHA